MLTFSDELLLNPDFTRWVTSNEGRVWMTLMGAITRKKNQNDQIYENFYKNNKLVANVSLDFLNEKLGYKSKDKSNVRKALDKLTCNSLIRKKHILVNKKRVNVYEVGYISNENNKEVPYAFEVFHRKKAKKNLEKRGFVQNGNYSE